MKIRPKKKPEMKVVYRYEKPKSEEEAKEQARKVSMAYDIIFKATIEQMEKSSDPKKIAFLKKFPWLREEKSDQR